MQKMYKNNTIFRLFSLLFSTFAPSITYLKAMNYTTKRKQNEARNGYADRRQARPKPNILRIDSPNDYARFVDAPVLHPLLSIIHYDELPPFRHSMNNYGVYGLFIQRQFPHILSYGMKTLQVSDGSIIAVEPGQIGGLEDNGERISLSGWVLLWSPELLNGTELEREIDRYQFFSYFFAGSLQMEPDEWLSITQLLVQMRQELLTHEDSPSLRGILLGYLHLILEYCNRIYLRQLSEENRGGNDLLKQFHNLLQTYFRENRQLSQGLPTVTWCASELAYSPRYFGDIIRKATGGTAIGYIHHYVINQAKSLLMQGHNVSETSRLLGFDFPHHFTRLFKRITGLTPSEFLGKHNV